MDLPLHLYQFWYPSAFRLFLRIWHNSLLILEEDLAVGLMWKLLLVPLFHDASIIGRIVSFIFRTVRILMGISAYFLVSLLVILICLSWFLAPLFVFLPIPVILGSHLIDNPLFIYLFESYCVAVLGIGICFYAYELLNKPLKKAWQLKQASEIWSATHLNKSQINATYLVQTLEVQDLLFALELAQSTMPVVAMTPNEALEAKVFELATKTKAHFITADFFIVASWLLTPTIHQDLIKYSLREHDLLNALQFLQAKRNLHRRVFIWDDDFAVRHLKGTNRGWMSTPTHALDAHSTDLTKLASTGELEDFIGRGAVVHEVISILSQTEDRNVLLVGPPGVGKSTLVRHLAKLIISGDAPEALATKRLVELDLAKLTSGITVQGELAHRLEQIFAEVSYSEDLILYIDEIHNLGIGDAGTDFNLYGLISPFLESGTFQFIASTEEKNYARIIEKNGSFARLFHKVLVSPATEGETLETIEHRALEYWYKTGIASTYVGLKELVEFAQKLIHDKVLPDSAISLLKECQPNAAQTKVINKELVKKVLENRVSVPVIELDDSQRQLLLTLEDKIHERMIDQEEAVNAVADTLRRASTSLREQNRPIGSFLFVGPTGVGKTELAKTLAELYFKDKGAFLRLDMSEYQTEDALNRLIGTEQNPGELTEAIKNRPYCLLLLDEFEKANSNLLTLFLQVLDDGRLTDYNGDHIDFTNTIIIATSNAASLTIAHGLEQNKTIIQLENEVREELLKILKPELVNRFDRIVLFKPLSETDLSRIVFYKLQDLTKMLEDQGYSVEFDDDIISEIARKGYDPVLGARPMKRVIQDFLESKLSKMILNNELKKGEPKHIDLKFLTESL